MKQAALIESCLCYELQLLVNALVFLNLEWSGRAEVIFANGAPTQQQYDLLLCAEYLARRGLTRRPRILASI